MSDALLQAVGSRAWEWSELPALELGAHLLCPFDLPAVAGDTHAVGRGVGEDVSCVKEDLTFVRASLVRLVAARASTACLHFACSKRLHVP